MEITLWLGVVREKKKKGTIAAPPSPREEKTKKKAAQGNAEVFEELWELLSGVRGWIWDF